MTRFLSLHFSTSVTLFFAAGLCLLCPQGQASLQEKSTSQTVEKTSSPAAAPHQDDTATHLLPQKQSNAFIDEMVARHGFSRSQLQETFKQMRRIDRAIMLMQPTSTSKPKNWTQYRNLFLTPSRIKEGVVFWNQYADALQRAQTHYGVPPEIIVAILGIETSYGKNTGNFRVMDVIATLAFSYPDTSNRSARMAYFRRELENTLLLARHEKIDPLSLFGSYAGAIGWPQFMPGNIQKYAVDFDGDGHIDLRHSPVDAIGSIANFLIEHGWQRDGPIAFPARVDTAKKEWRSFLHQGLKARYHLKQLRAAGITPEATTTTDIPYGLVDLPNGKAPTQYWLGAPNFFVITQYNRSFFYAMAVRDLAHALRMARHP